MNGYIDYENSLQCLNTDLRQQLINISMRYMLTNPIKLPVMRAFDENGFYQSRGGLYKLDFNKKFPDAKEDDYCYAVTSVYSSRDFVTRVAVRANSPVWVYLNGEQIFKTGMLNEAFNNIEPITITLKKGINMFLIKCRKNILGFGCEFGDFNPRLFSASYVNPIIEYVERSGFAYTKNYSEDIFAESESFPSFNSTAGDIWLSPENCEKISLKGKKGYAYFLSFIKTQNSAISLKGNFTRAFINSVEVENGKELAVNGEIQYIVFEKKCDESSENEYSFEIYCDSKRVEDTLGCMVKGTKAKHLFIGMFEIQQPDIINEFNILSMHGDKYYRTELKNTTVRLFLEGENFGIWNYPTGVVLYGLGFTGNITGNETIKEYVRKHLSIPAAGYRYTHYDTNLFGRAGINHQFIGVDALDYCGSCANALLYAMDFENKNVRLLADDVADYIQNKQERLTSGMFYRKQSGTKCENTIWADDLYMSVPFLCRYYEKTGDVAFLNDAINQYVHFKEYLYIPEKGYMSHIYSLNYEKRSGIPWGRGNGWVIFALTELLRVTPKDHEKYSFLLEFYRQLCEGYLALQDEEGMWHQILDDKESYMESSCTAMFVCAFARGIKNGWLEAKKFGEAARLGWEALIKYCIDKNGNIYGVCVGSGFSFRRDYYKYELPWNVNDTHGTGIVLLAGAELLNLYDGRLQ